MKLITNNLIRPLGLSNDIKTVVQTITNQHQDHEPFFICNVPEIKAKYRLWKNMFPRIQPFYGVNTNCSSIVLDTLAELGAGFECTTKSNIIQASSATNAGPIFLSSGCATNNLIKYAANSSVNLISADNYKDLLKISELYPKANLVIHVKAEHAEELSVSFGCDPNEEFDHLLRSARAFDLNVVGIHVNVTSNRENQAYFKAISMARELFDRAASFGYEFNLLSLGRGFPQSSLKRIAKELNPALERCFADLSVNVIANPAQFLVESAYTLSCKIQYIRDTEKINEQNGKPQIHFQYFINDGVFGSFNSVLYGTQNFTPQPAIQYPSSEEYSSSVWGPTGSFLDLIMEELLLPDMKVGDSILFDNMGIFTASSYNGFPIHKVYIIADDIWYHIQKDKLPSKNLYFVMGCVTEEMIAERKRRYRVQCLEEIPLDLFHYMDHGLL